MRHTRGVYATRSLLLSVLAAGLLVWGLSMSAAADDMDHSMHGMPDTAAGREPAVPMSGSTDHGGAMPPPAGSLPRSDGSAPLGYGAYGITAHMPDDPFIMKSMFDNLEYVHGRDTDGVAWDGKIRAGYDINRLWLRSEGLYSGGQIEDGDLEALWGHAISPFWDVVTGIRHDFGPGPKRNWGAVGVLGLAPYQFDVEATAYMGSSSRTAFRLKVSQDWLFTQNLILSPELDANAYGRADPERDLGSGLSNASLSLRLRYEISRKFAPYVGYSWSRSFSGTAKAISAAGGHVSDRRLLVGIRMWF